MARSQARAVANEETRTLLSPAFFRDPYPTYQALRAAGPLHWSEEFFGGAWLLTNYADVVRVLRDPCFSAQRAGGWANSSGPEARGELTGFKRIFARAMLFLNGPHHTRLRQVLNAGFKPTALQAMRPRIQARVDELLDAIDPDDEFDFMRAFARSLPALVMADMLGVDANDQAEFAAWSDDIAAFIGSPMPPLELARRAQTSLVALNEYFRELLPQRRRYLGDDLVSLLLRAEAAGQFITSKELLAQCAMLLFAGHETTRNLLGNGLHALLRHRGQWQLLRDTPRLMQSALRELLRFDSPVQYTGRRVIANVEMHGKRLKRGDLVILFLGAANRDPANFSNAEALQIARNEGNHLSFGYGPHVCIGASLTYMEAEIAFTGLMKRLPDLELSSEVSQWSPNPVYRSLATLPIRAAGKHTARIRMASAAEA